MIIETRKYKEAKITRRLKMIDEIKTQLYVCNIVMHACKNYSSGIGCEIMVH